MVAARNAAIHKVRNGDKPLTFQGFISHYSAENGLVSRHKGLRMMDRLDNPYARHPVSPSVTIELSVLDWNCGGRLLHGTFLRLIKWGTPQYSPERIAHENQDLESLCHFIDCNCIGCGRWIVRRPGHR